MDQTPNTQDKDADFTDVYQVVLVGDSGVGKTHLIKRYVKGELPKCPMPTIGIEFAEKIVKLNGIKIKYGILLVRVDMERSQPRTNEIIIRYLRRAEGGLILYDVTKYDSFKCAVRQIEEFRHYAGPDVVLILVGTKLDLVENNDARKAQKEDAQALAQAQKVLFLESSAFTGENVTICFETLYAGICRINQKYIKPRTKPLDQSIIRLNQINNVSVQEEVIAHFDFSINKYHYCDNTLVQ